jgi:hypothetical protein
MASMETSLRTIRLERVLWIVAVAGATIGACALAATLVFVLRDDPSAGGLAFLLPIGGLIAVGSLIVMRRRTNLVGWLSLLAGMLASLAMASGTYVDQAMTRPDSLPGLGIVGWFSLWLGNAWVWILISIALVFPDGRLPSRRWRPAAWLVAAFGITACVASAFDPNPAQWQELPYNSLGVRGAERLFVLLDMVAVIGFPASLATAVAAVVVRFRCSVGIERLQLKWLMYAMVLVGILGALISAAPNVFTQRVSDVVFGLAYGTLPVAIAVAVLRYRLYDIDHIIRRTVVYSLLTALLGAVYAGVVLILGQLFGGMGGHPPSWVIAGATLAVAGLFQPARRRIQADVNRRFNRSRYDAATTVTAFAVRLRDELDPDAVGVQLVAAVRHTMQPSQVSLWLRPTVGAALR